MLRKLPRAAHHQGQSRGSADAPLLRHSESERCWMRYLKRRVAAALAPGSGGTASVSRSFCLGNTNPCGIALLPACPHSTPRATASCSARISRHTSSNPTLTASIDAVSPCPNTAVRAFPASKRRSLPRSSLFAPVAPGGDQPTAAHLEPPKHPRACANSIHLLTLPFWSLDESQSGPR